MVLFSMLDYGFSDYPSGCNAVVAVLAYTGYDMEDAMILNKSSYERGFGHACVYKSFSYDLNEQSGMKKSRFKLMIHSKTNKNIDGIDRDGVPHIGSYVKKGSPEFVAFDTNKNEVKVHYHKDAEVGRIEQVAVIQNENDPQNLKF
jgi:DNA-directed RNA polymerase I subunit RPA2